MKNVLSKLAVARTHIRASKLTKDGKNSFSNYEYFTPELVSKLVNDACIEANIICVFNLKQDDHGHYGEVITTDLDSGEHLVSVMRTERPEIKATNATQQMGGMNTYTKRYALMTLFDIEDNSIDFDSGVPEQKQQKTSSDLPWLNEGTKEFNGAVDKMKAGQSSIEALKKYFKLSKKVEEKLLAAVKQ